jgi:hypothetical protein
MFVAALLFATVTVTASPQPIYIEAAEHSQSLNFDLIVTNGLDEPVDLDEVQLSAFDRDGKLLLRRLIDGNGTRPSIRTADAGSLAPNTTGMLFNPFHQFEPDLDLHLLRYDLKFSSQDGSRTFPVSVEVRPQPYRAHARLILPLASRFIVYDGHDFYGHHRRWDYTLPGIRQLGFKTNFMRYSYDFVPVDGEGRMVSGAEEKNENWVGFGRPIRAVAGGVIVSVRDDQPDDRKFDPGTIAADGPMKIWGNYVVVDHGHGEFSLYGHIKNGSSRVKVGQRVERGDVIAAIGASGSSKFPHLHYELQTGPDTNAEGLPSVFENFERIRGSKRLRVKTGHVETGEIVETR